MSNKHLYAIILAAGRSSRFGATKQLQSFRGEPLVRRAVNLAESVCGPQSILVVGNKATEVARAGGPLQGFITINSDFSQGLSTSIAAGVRSVADNAEGILLLLADQPLISETHLQIMIDKWQQAQDQIVATAFNATIGPPVIFPKRDFSLLLNLQGDRGARSVIESQADRVVRIEFAAAEMDIDWPDDLETIH